VNMTSLHIDGFSKCTYYLQWRNKNVGTMFFKDKSQVNFGGAYLNWEKENIWLIRVVPTLHCRSDERLLISLRLSNSERN